MLQVGKPVKGKWFIGREQEIEEIMNYLSIGQSVVLIAPRRFGKTSLVLEIMERLKKRKYYVGFLDIFQFASLQQLTYAIIEEVLENHGLKRIYQQAKGSISALFKNVKLKGIIENFEFLISMEDTSIDGWTNFSSALDFINDFPKSSNKKIVFAFDEYGDILKFDRSVEIIKMMRAKIQVQNHACFIFSGSYESVMDGLFTTSKSPFYRMAKIIHIGYLPFQEVKTYMLDSLQEYKIFIEENLIEDIIDFLKGHPYYCQLALQQIYLHQSTSSDKLDLDFIIDLIIQSDRNYLEKIWENLAKNKEYVTILKYLTTNAKGVYSIAKTKGINVSRALNKLEGRGIIYKRDRKYYFYDPIFQVWLAKTIQL